MYVDIEWGKGYRDLHGHNSIEYLDSEIYQCPDKLSYK